MNDRKEQSGHDKLSMPAPRSPDALDKRILSYARENAPVKPASTRGRLLRHPWASGLATACVVGVALFISEPDQQISTLAPAPIEALIPAAAQAVPTQGAIASPAARKAINFRSESSSLYTVEEKEHAEVAADTHYSAEAEPLGAVSDTLDTGDLQASQEPLLRQELQRCAELLGAGNVEEARSAYRKLRLDCPECELPETLEQALAAYPQDY